MRKFIFYYWPLIIAGQLAYEGITLALKLDGGHSLFYFASACLLIVLSNIWYERKYDR